MASFPVYFTNLRCDGCGKVIKIMGDTAAHARRLAALAGWRSGLRRQGRGRSVYDACQDCDLPEGYA